MTYKGIVEILEGLEITSGHAIVGDWVVMPCPFANWRHSTGKDRNPSFGISINNEGLSGYNCFTCKSRGRLSGLVRSLGHLRGEDYTRLATKCDLLEITSSDIAFEDFDHENPEDEPLDPMIVTGLYEDVWKVPEAREYLVNRKISERTSGLLGLVYDPDQQRVLFPIRNRLNQCYGFTGRSILKPEQYPFHKYPKIRDYQGLKKERHLLGQEFLTGEKPVILVEGLFAYARMKELDLDFADTVASMGSHLSDRQGEKLIANSQTVYIFYDNDEAGDAGIFGKGNKGGGAVDLFTAQLPCLIGDPWPEGKDDPDDLTLEEVKDMMDKAILP